MPTIIMTGPDTFRYVSDDPEGKLVYARPEDEKNVPQAQPRTQGRALGPGDLTTAGYEQAGTSRDRSPMYRRRPEPARTAPVRGRGGGGTAALPPAARAPARRGPAESSLFDRMGGGGGGTAPPSPAGPMAQARGMGREEAPWRAFQGRMPEGPGGGLTRPGGMAQPGGMSIPANVPGMERSSLPEAMEMNVPAGTGMMPRPSQYGPGSMPGGRNVLPPPAAPMSAVPFVPANRSVEEATMGWNPSYMTPGGMFGQVPPGGAERLTGLMSGMTGLPEQMGLEEYLRLLGIR